MKKQIALLASFILAIFLTSCGGGSSSGGPQFVGTYIGTATLTLSAPAGSETGENLGVQFVISPNGVVSVSDPGMPVYAEGPLTGNTFLIIAAGSVLDEPGVLMCTGTFTFTGTISGNMMTGTVSSDNLGCNGVPFTLTGSFTATLQAQGSISLPAKGLRDQIRESVKQQ